MSDFESDFQNIPMKNRPCQSKVAPVDMNTHHEINIFAKKTNEFSINKTGDDDKDKSDNDSDDDSDCEEEISKNFYKNLTTTIKAKALEIYAKVIFISIQLFNRIEFKNNVFQIYLF